MEPRSKRGKLAPHAAFAEALTKSSRSSGGEANDDAVWDAVDKELIQDARCMGELIDMLLKDHYNIEFKVRAARCILFETQVGEILVAREECRVQNVGDELYLHDNVTVCMIIFAENGKMKEFSSLAHLLEYVPSGWMSERGFGSKTNQFFRFVSQQKYIPYLEVILKKREVPLKQTHWQVIMSHGCRDAVMMLLQARLHDDAGTETTLSLGGNARCLLSNDILRNDACSLVRAVLDRSDKANLVLDCVDIVTLLAEYYRKREFEIVVNYVLRAGGARDRNFGVWLDRDRICGYARINWISSFMEVFFTCRAGLTRAELNTLFGIPWHVRERRILSSIGLRAVYHRYYNMPMHLLRLHLWHARIEDFIDHSVEVLFKLGPLLIHAGHARFKVCAYHWITTSSAAVAMHPYYVKGDDWGLLFEEEWRDFAWVMFSAYTMLCKVMRDACDENERTRFLACAIDANEIRKIATAAILYPVKCREEWLVEIPFFYTRPHPGTARLMQARDGEEELFVLN